MENREVILDVETTGLDFEYDRIIEIGIVETYDKVPTGDYYHLFFKPEDRLMTQGAINVSGITDEFLQDKPLFKDHYEEILRFINDSPIVAHNANFDISMLNAELKRMKVSSLKNKIVDTLKIARKIFKSNNSLDGLCKKYKVDIRGRKLHGALKDAKLLSSIYYHLSLELNDNSLDINSLETLDDHMEEEKFFFKKRDNPSKILAEDKMKHLNIMELIRKT